MRNPFVLTVLLLCCGTIYLFLARLCGGFRRKRPDPARRAAAPSPPQFLLTVVVRSSAVSSVSSHGPSNLSFLRSPASTPSRRLPGSLLPPLRPPPLADSAPGAH
jgi:hypothetical protein